MEEVEDTVDSRDCVDERGDAVEELLVDIAVVIELRQLKDVEETATVGKCSQHEGAPSGGHDSFDLV